MEEREGDKVLNTLHRVWFLSAYAYIYPHTLIYISPQQGRWDLLSRMRLTNRLKKVGVAYFARRSTHRLSEC